MNKILVQVTENIMRLKKQTNLSDEQKNLLNTNIISDNELIFSDEYIIKNEKIIISFLKEVAQDQKINTIYLYKSSIPLELIKIISKIEPIENLVIKDDFLITHDMVEVLKNSKLKTISVYSMHDFFTEYLDKFDKIVEVRKEIFFTSDFSKSNELTKYTSLLYKKNINLTFPFSSEDEEEFKIFTAVNKYLKVIHINKCEKSDLEKIINEILINKKNNIKIILHENVVEEKLVEYIKKINSAHKKENITISVSYSDAYLKKNMFAQFNLNILKVCFLLIILLVIGTYLYYVIGLYIDNNTDTYIKELIETTILEADTEVLIEKLETESEKIVINEYIASLMTLNMDAVGWISVPGTNIDYPLVLGDDNDYYLEYSIEGSYTRIGTIFLDYKNSGDFTDDNTVIYGHNFSGSTIMFSSLNTISTDEWLSNEDYRIITIDTLYESLEYQIFSYYTTEITIDYLNINYANSLDRLDFYTMLQERSEYDFEIEIDNLDKILTLSTCSDSGTKRFVVHAVLID